MTQPISNGYFWYEVIALQEDKTMSILNVIATNINIKAKSRNGEVFSSFSMGVIPACITL